MLLDERSSSIVMQHAQKVALEILEAELRLELWKLPAKPAERLAAFEARFDAIVNRLHDSATAMYAPLGGASLEQTPAKSAAARRGPKSTVTDDPFP